MSLGLFIGRLNPPHNGHLQTITTALSENDLVLLLLGSPEVQDEKNPLNFDERKELMQIVFPQKHLVISELVDNPSDELWIKDVLQFIQEQVPEGAEITFYGGDFQNDSAYTSFKLYEAMFSDYNISYKEISRKGSMIQDGENQFDLSATNFRAILEKGDDSLAKKFTSPDIFEKLKKIYK